MSLKNLTVYGRLISNIPPNGVIRRLRGIPEVGALCIPVTLPLAIDAARHKQEDQTSDHIVHLPS